MTQIKYYNISIVVVIQNHSIGHFKVNGNNRSMDIFYAVAMENKNSKSLVIRIT